MNVAASTLNRVSSRHVRLVGVHVTPQQPLPDEARALTERATGRTDLEFEIPGYATGGCSIFV
jgi:hypothetical protein